MIIAGIGSRKTPKKVLDLMVKIGEWALKNGHEVRSGHAEGADYAFECGARDNCTAYMPWRSFNSKDRKMTKNWLVWDDIDPSVRARAIRSVKKYHPNSSRVLAKQSWTKLHARNYFQIMGHGLLEQPVNMVWCWTPQGKGGGGTGQAIRLAKANGIKVFDLGNPSVYDAALKKLS